MQQTQCAPEDRMMKARCSERVFSIVGRHGQQSIEYTSHSESVRTRPRQGFTAPQLEANHKQAF